MQTVADKTYLYVDTVEKLKRTADEIVQYRQSYPLSPLAVDLETRRLDGKTTLPRAIPLHGDPFGDDPDSVIYDGYMATMGIGFHPRYLDRQFVVDARKLGWRDIHEYLKQPLEEATIIGHALKYDWPFLFFQTHTMLKTMRDTQIIAQIIGAGDWTQKLPSLMEKYREYFDWGWFKDFTGMDMDEFEGFKTKYQTTDWNVEHLSDEHLYYQASDVRMIHYVYERQCEDIVKFRERYERNRPADKGSIYNCIQLECACIPIFALMEMRGIQFDEEYHANDVIPFLKHLSKEARDILAKEFTETKKCGEGRGKKRQVWEEQVPIKIRSPRFLAALRKHVPELTSMDKDEVKFFVDKHPSVKWVMQYKRAAHLEGSFGQKLINIRYPDGKIHADVHQIGTKTGRSSGAKPNMMQIPRRGKVGDRKAGDVFRRSFICPVGYVLGDYDYSQIEPRVAAALYRELELLAEYAKGRHADIYAIAAKAFLGLEEVPKTKGEYDRDSMKTGFLGKLYRESPKGLADRIYLDTTGAINWRDESKFGPNYPELISERFDETFSNIAKAAKLYEKLVRQKPEALGSLAEFKPDRQGRKEPFFVVQDHFGRIEGIYLYKEQEKLPDFLLAKDVYIKKKKKVVNPDTNELEVIEYTTRWNHFMSRLDDAGREAFNFTIQGLCASILKLALRMIHVEFLAAGFHWTEGVIMVIHDEGLFQVREEHREKAQEIIERCMVEAANKILENSVEIIVEGGWGKSWAEAKNATRLAGTGWAENIAA